ncbi:YccF domain-containing protein [Microbacterium sp. P05]|uniref:YccF domain-containing protein n=1 Tax=Microbacterium sp. P05 TaxID=3366948 RepID=UPI0037456D0C
MRLVLNIIWLVLSGFWLFLGYLAAGIVLCILILTIPWGIASLRIAGYVIWPFGREVIAKPTAGAGAFLGNVVWVILAGWWLALGHIVSGLLLCVTIIGIPLGIANFKLVSVSLMPLGRQIVPVGRGPFDVAGAR